MKSMKFKRTVLLLTLLVTTLSAVTGGTIAWFTDSVASENNIIASGNLDVEMYWADGKTDPAAASWKDASKGAIFTHKLWEPGYTEVRHVQIKNEGNLALKFQLSIEANGAVSKLADAIDVYFIDPARQIAGRADLAGLTPAGTLSEMIKGMPANTYGNLEAGNAATVTLALKMRESAGNEYQNLAIGSDFSLVLQATQYTSESDSFDNTYDADAELTSMAYVSNQNELIAALKNNASVIYLSEGSYTMPDGSDYVDLRGKSVTFKGSKASVLDAANIDMRDQFVTGANLTFDGITIKFGGAEYMGFANPVSAVYKNCDIIGLQYLSGNTVTYDNCDFISVNNASGKPAYCVGTYTAKEVSFNNCTFDTAGKALLIYAESHFDSQVVNVKDCTFNASATATTSAGDACAAIEIDASLIKDTYTLKLEGVNTVGEKFNGLYRIKNQKNPSNVIVDDKNNKVATNLNISTQDDFNALIDSEDIVNITLASGNYEMPDGTYASLQGKTVTITGNKGTVIDVSNVDERDQFVTGASLTFEGVTLNFGTVNYMGFANAKTLTYKDCDINGLQFLYGPSVVFEDCTLNANGAEHCVWTWGVENVSFDNCDFTYEDRAVNCYGENVTTNASFKDCTFTKVAGKATTGAIETNSSALTALNLTIENCSVNEGNLGWVSIWDSKLGANTTANVK